MRKHRVVDDASECVYTQDTSIPCAASPSLDIRQIHLACSGARLASASRTSAFLAIAPQNANDEPLLAITGDAEGQVIDQTAPPVDFNREQQIAIQRDDQTIGKVQLWLSDAPMHAALAERSRQDPFSSRPSALASRCR